MRIIITKIILDNYYTTCDMNTYETKTLISQKQKNTINNCKVIVKKCVEDKLYEIRFVNRTCQLILYIVNTHQW